jgi:hypothetical protein
MALRFMDSFDHYNTSQLARKWTTVSGNMSISAGNGRRSTACMRANDWNASTGMTFDQQATWIIGFGFKCAALPGANRRWVEIDDGGSTQVYVQVDTAGTVSIINGGSGTVLATSGTALAAGSYNYMEFKFVIHNTTGSVEVRRNGVSMVSVSGANTRNTSNNSGNRILLYSQGGSVGATIDNDDLYMCDGQGSANNNFLGDVRIDATFPNAEASLIQWTPSTGTDNSALVDETPANDDTDYNSDSTPGDIDLYDFPAIAPTSGTVYAVAVQMTVRKDDAGARTIRSKIKQGGTTYSGSTQAVGTSYSIVTELVPQDPNTSAPWTISGVNAAEFGLELVS